MHSADSSTTTSGPDALTAAIQRLESRCAACPGCPDSIEPLERLRSGVQAPGATESFEAAVARLLDARERCLEECPNPAGAGALAHDVPTLLLGLRAQRHAAAGASRASRWYSNPDRTGTLRSLLPRTVERLIFSAPGRWLGRILLGTAPAKGMRPVERPPFREQVGAPRAAAALRGAPAAELFHTCQVDYFEASAGWACLEVLEGHGVATAVPVQSCCGLVCLQQGDLEGAAALARKSVERLLPHVRSGRSVVVASSSCAEMLRNEAPRLLGTEDAAVVAAAVQPWAEYVQRRRAIDPEAPAPVASSPQRVGFLSAPSGASTASMELMAEIPGLEVIEIPALSGILDFPGSGAPRGHRSAAILGTGLESIRAAGADVLVTDCRLAAREVESALGILVRHPAELLRGRYAMYRRPSTTAEPIGHAPEEGVPQSALESVLLRQRRQEAQARVTLLSRPVSPGPAPPP